MSGQFSSAVLLSSGVPKGSVLGPVLYILYTTPIQDISTSYGISDHQYAYDDKKYVSFQISNDGANQRRVFSSLSACIAETRRWGAQNRIKYNDSKTEVMLVYSKHVGVEPAPYLLTVGDADIRPVSTVEEKKSSQMVEENSSSSPHDSTYPCLCNLSTRLLQLSPSGTVEDITRSSPACPECSGSSHQRREKVRTDFSYSP